MLHLIQTHFVGLKTFHVLAIISWMAGIFYLPRLFVYHATPHYAYAHDVFIVMERKLYKMIMIPAMLASWITGILIAWHHFIILSYNIQLASANHTSIFSEVKEWWFIIKLVAVVLLTIYDQYLNYLRLKFRERKNIHSHVYYRYLNEVPTLLMIVIVIMVMMRPF